MKRIYNLFCLILPLMAMVACQEEMWDVGVQLPGDGKLRFQGVNAQQVVVKTRADENGRKGFFPEGTRYRIWAYGNESGGNDRIFRFNACGKDTKINDNSHMIAMPEGTELAFKNTQNDVIDFYGLTNPDDNKSEEDTDYLKATDTNNPQYVLKYNDENGNAIPDLRYAEKKDNKAQTTSYIIPLEFRHILSKVTFEVLQQADEEDNTKGKFEGIYLESIQVLNRPSSGTFDVKKGVFTSFGEKRDFTLTPKKQELGIVPSAVDSILLFPTAEDETSPLNVKVTLSGKETTFNDFANQDGYEVTNNGASLTVTCPVYDSYKVSETGEPIPLRFKPNFRYVLQLMIMGNDVRIVTVVPRVYEWLDGETDHKDENGKGYEDQDLGQPVTFGGVVWSDRNLGANSAHPLSSVDEWRKSVGYFYQFNRNIPYFPNTFKNNDVNLNTPLREALHEEASKGNFRNLYPVVNYRAWDLSYVRPGEDWYPPAQQDKQAIKPISGMPHDCFVYTIGGTATVTDSPKWTPGHRIIRFGVNISNNGKQGNDERKFPGQRWLWRTKEGTKGEQPCPQGWSVPTEAQFKSIIPTSGYAGNITFRNFLKRKDTDDGGWDAALGDKNNEQFREHDFPDVFKKGGDGLTYREELRAGAPMIDEAGNEKAYLGTFPCLFREEKDDPQAGATSQYVLSMYEDDWTMVQDASGNLNEGDKTIDYVYNWGVIYGIKNQGTSNAYRVKWEVKVVGNPTEISDLSKAKKFCENPETKMYDGKTALRYDHLYCYLVISRYPATVTDNLSPDENGSCEWVAKNKDWWSNPSEVMYLPIGGVAGFFRAGQLYNIGTEVRYGLVDESDKTYTEGGKTYEGAYKRCVWLKIAGSSTASLGLFFENSYTSDLITIRPVRD